MVENELALRQRCDKSCSRRKLTSAHQQIEHETCSCNGFNAPTYIDAIEPTGIGFVVCLMSYAHKSVAIWSVHQLRDDVGYIGCSEIDPADHAYHRGLSLQELDGLVDGRAGLHEHGGIDSVALGYGSQIVRCEGAIDDGEVVGEPRVRRSRWVPEMVVRVDAH